MTTFTGSLFVNALDSETTAFGVDQSGNVTIAGNITASGTSTFSALSIVAATAYSTAQVSAFTTAGGGFASGSLRLYEVKVVAAGTTISLLGINPRFTF